jgi:hypothetical protein
MASGREIRISLVTALNAAGIEATKQQLDILTGKVKQANAAMGSAAKVGGEWTKLPGPIGKVQNALGGVSAAAFAVIGAFKTGCDIGNWIQEKIIVPLFKIKDPIDELKKANRELKREADAAAAAWSKSQDAVARQLEEDAKAADAAVAKIDRLTAAYVKMQNARLSVQNAESDAEELGLQRDKFSAMTAAANDGDDKKAAAEGKRYDILIEEVRQKREIARADAEIAKTAKEIESREKSITELKKDESAAKTAYLKAARTAQRVYDGDELEDVWGEDWEKAVATANKNRDKAMAEWKRLTEKRKGKEDDLGVLKVEADAKQKERDNAASAAELEIDKRKQEYSDYIKEVKRQNEEAAKKAADEVRRLDAEASANRKRLADEELTKKIKSHQELLKAEQSNAADAKGAQAAAESKLQQAWYWYRNKDAMAAQMQEEKADKEAQKQYEIDFEKLKDKHRDWRDAEDLTVDEEATRRVALAKEEKEAADKHLAEIEKNTADLAKKLDELLQVKG